VERAGFFELRMELEQRGVGTEGLFEKDIVLLRSMLRQGARAAAHAPCTMPSAPLRHFDVVACATFAPRIIDGAPLDGAPC
jgi:hypothetical protein